MKKSNQKGQALILVIVASAVLISTISTAVLLAISTGKNEALDLLGKQVYYAAESGEEYALLKLMRNPSYSICPTVSQFVPALTESITINSITVNLSYQAAFNGCYVKATAQKGTVLKSVQVLENLDNYLNTKVSTYCCWDEIP